jgi:glycosyltransferase involved in cell wall biosynthesis
MIAGLVRERSTATARRGRLMLITSSLSLKGGAETQTVEIALGLRARGWDVDLVTMLPPAPPVPDLTGSGIREHCLHMRPSIPDPSAIVRLAALIRRYRPDVVNSHMTHANLLARATRPFCRIPVLVCTLHGYKMYSVKTGRCGLREAAHRLTDRLADTTTVVCQAAADRYARIGAVAASKLVVVPNGIRMSAYRCDPSIRARERRQLGLGGEFLWLAAGRLEKVKDYATMLRAFRMALAADGRQVLAIGGDGTQRNELERLTRALEIAGNVRFLGHRSDLPNLMAAADGFVMSSIFEGMPLVLLEAAASALPIVATRVGGNAEIVPEGKGGLLAPSQDPAALGRAMELVVSMSPAERGAMGRAAREFVRGRYAMEAVLDRWEELYFDLLERKPAGLRERVER